MALSDIIAAVADRSGRADLNVTPWTQLIGYINAGQKMLDRMLLEEKNTARMYVEITAGKMFAAVKYCRTVEEVWIYAGDGRTQLTRIDTHELRKTYKDETTAITAAQPAFYCIERVRPIGDSSTTPEVVTTLTGFSQTWAIDNVVKSGAWHGYTGIVWMPPADAAYTMEIVGQFDSIVLDSTNVTKSYWTEVYPHVLTWAALYMMEIEYRNTEGAKDWLAGIQAALDLENKDIVEMENINQMEG